MCVCSHACMSLTDGHTPSMQAAGRATSAVSVCIRSTWLWITVCCTSELLDHLVVVLQCLLHNCLWLIHLPLPLRPHWVGVVPPAEHTLVGARQAGSGLHAAVALNPVEGVLVAASPAPQHGLGPAAQFNARVGPHNAVAWEGRGQRLDTRMEVTMVRTY